MWPFFATASNATPGENRVNQGDVILQPGSFDLSTALIWFHYLTEFQKPQFVHCGVFISGGKMATADGGHVEMQDAGAAGNVALSYAWKDWPRTQAWLKAQLGKPYDWFGWVLAAVDPITKRLGFRPKLSNKTYTCSGLVAAAMIYDDPTVIVRCPNLQYRTVTPDDVRDACR